MAGVKVRVLPALDPGESYTESNFLLVETVRDENGQAVSSIDHISDEAIDTDSTDWGVRTLGGPTHLSHADAMEWALSYAKAHRIPVVYERDETVEPIDTIIVPRPDLEGMEDLD